MWPWKRAPLKIFRSDTVELVMARAMYMARYSADDSSFGEFGLFITVTFEGERGFRHVVKNANIKSDNHLVEFFEAVLEKHAKHVDREKALDEMVDAHLARSNS